MTHVGDAERPACDRLGSPHDATNAVLGHHIPRLVLQPESSITYSSRECLVPDSLGASTMRWMGSL